MKDRTADFTPEFERAITELMKKMLWVWRGVFLASLAYLLVSYFFTLSFLNIAFLYYFLPFATALCCALSFTIYHNRRLGARIGRSFSIALESYDEVGFSQMNPREQSLYLMAQKRFGGLTICWGINELIAFFGLVNALLTQADFSTHIYYFLLSIVLNLHMRPPIAQLMKTLPRRRS